MEMQSPQMTDYLQIVTKHTPTKQVAFIMM